MKRRARWWIGVLAAGLPAVASAGRAWAQRPVTTAVPPTLVQPLDPIEEAYARAAVLRFRDWSSELSDASSLDLRRALTRARTLGTVTGAVIAAWPDENFPRTPGASLAEPAVALADQRLATTRAAVQSLEVPRTAGFALAQYPTWLAAPPHEDAGGATNDPLAQPDAVLAAAIRALGGPGRVVVIFTTAPTTAVDAP